MNSLFGFVFYFICLGHAVAEPLDGFWTDLENLEKKIVNEIQNKNHIQIPDLRFHKSSVNIEKSFSKDLDMLFDEAKKLDKEFAETICGIKNYTEKELSQALLNCLDRDIPKRNNSRYFNLLMDSFEKIKSRIKKLFLYAEKRSMLNLYLEINSRLSIDELSPLLFTVWQTYKSKISILYLDSKEINNLTLPPSKNIKENLLSDINNYAKEIWKNILICTNENMALAKKYYETKSFSCVNNTNLGKQIEAEILNLHIQLMNYLWTSAPLESLNLFLLETRSRMANWGRFASPLLTQALVEFLALTWKDPSLEQPYPSSLVKKVALEIYSDGNLSYTDANTEIDFATPIRNSILLGYAILGSQSCDNWGLWPEYAGFMDDGFNLWYQLNDQNILDPMLDSLKNIFGYSWNEKQRSNLYLTCKTSSKGNQSKLKSMGKLYGFTSIEFAKCNSSNSCTPTQDNHNVNSQPDSEYQKNKYFRRNTGLLIVKRLDYLTWRLHKNECEGANSSYCLYSNPLREF